MNYPELLLNYSSTTPDKPTPPELLLNNSGTRRRSDCASPVSSTSSWPDAGRGWAVQVETGGRAARGSGPHAQPRLPSCLRGGFVCWLTLAAHVGAVQRPAAACASAALATRENSVATMRAGCAWGWRPHARHAPGSARSGAARGELVVGDFLYAGPVCAGLSCTRGLCVWVEFVSKPVNSHDSSSIRFVCGDLLRGHVLYSCAWSPRGCPTTCAAAPYPSWSARSARSEAPRALTRARRPC